LLGLRDPWTGAKVVRAVHAREALFHGPFVTRAPDLLLELELDAGYSYNLMPSTESRAPFRKLEVREHLGRKGRSLAGSHRDRGLYVAAGPSVLPVGRLDPSIPAHIADASATLLARLGVAPPADASGRVLPILSVELPPAARASSVDVRTTSSTHAAASSHAEHDARAGERKVAERLRNLGYIE
jgi:hypothetical protein